MDLQTIVGLLVTLLLGLGGGVWISRKKSVGKAGEKSKVATDTRGDVMQMDGGSVKKTQHTYHGSVIVINVDPNTLISAEGQERIKKAYLKTAETYQADQQIMKHAEMVATTSSSTIATVSKAIPYISTIIAEATGSEENEITGEIVRDAALEGQLEIIEVWVCSRCGTTNIPDGRYCYYCGTERKSG